MWGGISYPKIKHGMGFNYIPGPLTQYPSIRKVMASQVYDYLSGEIFERPLLPNGVREYTEESTKEFSRYFIYSLQEMKKTLNTDVMIALTGGYDSRTLISLAEQSGIDYECFTFTTEFMNTGGDVELPPQICKLLNRKHRIIGFDKSDFSKERKEKYLRHSSGMAQDGDLHHYTYGQWNRVADGRMGDVTVLYSGIWEIAIEYFSTRTKGLKENPTCYNDIIKAFPDILFDETKNSAIKLWLANIEDSDYRSVMSDANRFYWEQRDGCWMSYIAQSFDMIDHVQMLQPCNCRLFISFLLGWPHDKRLGKEHQKEIIGYNMPELLNILFTDDYPKAKVSITEKITSRLKRYYYYTKWYGMKWVVDKMVREKR